MSSFAPIQSPPSGQPPIGKSPARVDGVSKVTGAAKYLDDLDIPGCMYGQTVRSSVAHGVLRSIRLDPQFNWSQIVVVTADDIPGKNVVALIEDDQPALVPIGGRVHHHDEAIALVAAPTRKQAREAAKHILIDVDPLPAVLTIEDSLARKGIVYGTDNVFKRFDTRKGQDVEAVLKTADLVVEGTYRTGAQEQMYIEPQAMAAQWLENGKVRVFGSMQCPYYVHKAMKALLAMQDDDIIVAQTVTGGGFGGKEEYPSMLAAHVVLLARKARRPVKIVYDRAEDIGATTKRHPAVVKHRMGINRDGRILAVDIDVVLDGGAYLTLSPVVLSRAVLHAAGPYRIDNVRVQGRVVATNHPPHGAFRGFGAPQTTFAYERQMQKAARMLRIEPFDLRRRNMLRLGDLTATSQTLKYSVGSVKVLEEVQKKTHTATAADLTHVPRGPRIRRGRGLAFYFHGAGFTGSGEERLKGRASVAVARDGLFEVRASSTEIGQGTLTIFAQIAAESLGVDISMIRVPEPSTERVPDSGPTVASRTCMVVGGVVERAAKQLKERLGRFAKERALEGDLVEVARVFARERGEAVETSEYQSPPGVRWDDETYSGDAYPVYGWAACLVDVAVDTDTYEVSVERCIHAIDVGKAIHPVIVSGQIEGGTLQALGWALWENVVYKQGRVMNRRMTDCIIPTAIEAPEMETLIIEEPYPFGPHGAKGVGEIPMDGPGAAVAGAIEDALGVAMDELPLLPEVISKILVTRGAR